MDTNQFAFALPLPCPSSRPGDIRPGPEFPPLPDISAGRARSLRFYSIGVDKLHPEFYQNVYTVGGRPRERLGLLLPFLRRTERASRLIHFPASSGKTPSIISPKFFLNRSPSYNFSNILEV